MDDYARIWSNTSKLYEIRLNIWIYEISNVRIAIFSELHIFLLTLRIIRGFFKFKTMLHILHLR